MSATINVNDPAIVSDLEARLYLLKQRFTNAYGISVDMEIDATAIRARAIASRLAAPGVVGQNTAEGVLEHLVGRCFWYSALGRAIAYQCGASGEVGDQVNRRMVLQIVTGISRQGSYKVQAGLLTDGSGNIKANALRDYLQKREAANA
jgi:hypothetical protein